MNFSEEGIILDYYDGPMSGLLRTAARVVAFSCAWIDNRWIRRVYAISPSTERRYLALKEELAKYEPAVEGMWYPFSSGNNVAPFDIDWTTRTNELAEPTGPVYAFTWGNDFPREVETVVRVDPCTSFSISQFLEDNRSMSFEDVISYLASKSS